MNQEIRLNNFLLSAVKMIRETIDQHPLEWKSTDELAEQAAINRKLVQKAFKQVYGVKISEYQLHKRMETATDMLGEGRLSKKQIAARCGYHKANNFSIAFRKVYKMSPTDWQVVNCPKVLE